MNFDLRYCEKCKHNTLQVEERILTMEAASDLNHYMRWKRSLRERDGKDFEYKKEYDEERARLMLSIWYCPQCGKRWQPMTEETKIRYYIEEFKPRAYFVELA